MKIKYPIIVEGKYDKIKLDSIFDATVITTEGFGIFNDKEKSLLFRRLAEKSPLILREGIPCFHVVLLLFSVFHTRNEGPRLRNSPSLFS